MAQCSQSRIIHLMKTSRILKFSAHALCKTRLIAHSLSRIPHVSTAFLAVPAIHRLRRKAV